MRNRKAKEKNYLVTNYDSCALTVYGTHPKLISKPLIAFAHKNEFDGFYGLSGRHFSKDIPDQTYNFLDFLTHLAMKKDVKSGKSIYSKATIKANYTTCQTTLNIQEATGLKCQAVSTAEDLVKGRNCGEGFEEVIKPYEMKHVMPADHMRIHEKEMTKADINLGKSKNPLLLQIARHAAKHNPDASITLDVIEDNKHCALAAKTAKKDPHWPKNVKLNVMLMKGKGDKAKLMPMSMQSTPALETKEEPMAEPSMMMKAKMEMPSTPLMAHGTFGKRVTRSMAKVEEKASMEHQQGLRQA